MDHDGFLVVALTENVGCTIFLFYFIFFLDFRDDFLRRDCRWLSDECRRLGVASRKPRSVGLAVSVSAIRQSRPERDPDHRVAAVNQTNTALSRNCMDLSHIRVVESPGRKVLTGGGALGTLSGKSFLKNGQNRVVRHVLSPVATLLPQAPSPGRSAGVFFLFLGKQ